MESLLDGQNRHSSALLTSFNYQKETAKVGFDWPTIDVALDKFAEEWQEFHEEVKNGTKESQTDELGDVLFTIVNISRFLKLSPEEAPTTSSVHGFHSSKQVSKKVGENSPTIHSTNSKHFGN